MHASHNTFMALYIIHNEVDNNTMACMYDNFQQVHDVASNYQRNQRKNKGDKMFHRDKCNNCWLPVENIQIPAKEVEIMNLKRPEIIQKTT